MTVLFKKKKIGKLKKKKKKTINMNGMAFQSIVMCCHFV